MVTTFIKFFEKQIYHVKLFKSLKVRLNRLMGKNLMIMLPFTRYLRFLRTPKFPPGYWPRFVFGALRIDKNRVILVFIIATLPVYLVQILFTRFSTAFYTPLIFLLYFYLQCNFSTNLNWCYFWMIAETDTVIIFV